MTAARRPAAPSTGWGRWSPWSQWMRWSHWMRWSRRHRPGRRSDRGSGTVLALAIASVGVALALLVGGLGLAVIARHRATAAADLAALAAAGAEPPSCAVAADLARRNGARLGECLVAPDGSVTVTVGVSIGLPGAHQAVGRARAGTPGTGVPP